MANIIKHQEFEETYDNPDHPIPSLTHIEVCGILKKGGSNLGIVIAKPLESDDYSLNRLLDKIEKYLGHIRSPDHIAAAGEPNPLNTTITVHIHPQSSAEAFMLLEQSKPWVAQNRATLEVVQLSEE